MMKKIISTISFAAISLLALQSCDAQKVVVNRQVETQNDGSMLLGTQTIDQFQKTPFSDWYTKEHDEYKIDETSVAELKKEKLNSYQIVTFLGTWCEDSHREFPRLMKILEAVDYPDAKLTIIAVNKKKEAPNGEEGLYNIQKVPTIIVKKYGKEIGRIIEFPKTGFLERDLLEIIKKDNNGSVIGEIFKK